MGQNLYEVKYYSNGYTSYERTERYLKRRCAELTLEKGFTHYVVVQKNGSSEMTIKLLKNPPENLVAFDAQTVMKSTAD
jgi:hypothetical protein